MDEAPLWLSMALLSMMYEVTFAYFVTWFIQYRYPLVCHTISSTSVIRSF